MKKLKAACLSSWLRGRRAPAGVRRQIWNPPIGAPSRQTAATWSCRTISTPTTCATGTPTASSARMISRHSASARPRHSCTKPSRASPRCQPSASIQGSAAGRRASQRSSGYSTALLTSVTGSGSQDAARLPGTLQRSAPMPRRPGQLCSIDLSQVSPQRASSRRILTIVRMYPSVGWRAGIRPPPPPISAGSAVGKRPAAPCFPARTDCSSSSTAWSARTYRT